MAILKSRSKRKCSGGRYWPARKKRLAELGPDPTLTRVSTKTSVQRVRRRGGRRTSSLLTATFANLNLGKGSKKVRVTAVVENAASRHFVRKNIITKGALIKTEEGLARVTNRPGPHGVVNAVLVKKK